MAENYTCPVCSSERCELFLSRESVPVQQNFLAVSHAKAKNTQRGNLRMLFCHSCGFVFNGAFDPLLMVYDSDYNNTQESSECFKSHLLALKERLVNGNALKNVTIAEIGCGKGFFLKMLVLDDALGNRGYGFDPSYEGEEVLDNGRLVFEKKYFDGSCRGFRADALLCRHVIEHIPRSPDFIAEIREALSESPDCKLFFETPCVDWIFENLTIWDFFYEHCSLFSSESITRLFNQTGFAVIKLEHVFGGQYLWLEAVKSLEKIEIAPYTGRSIEKMKKFAAYEKEAVSKWVNTMNLLKKSGPVAIWGAGAKGVTFVNLVDKRCDQIEFVIDLNPDKHNRFVPGTGHRVVGFEELVRSEIKNVIVMNPNYVDEIRALLSNAGAEVNLIIEPGENNENSN